jgi:hypothetical protein
MAHADTPLLEQLNINSSPYRDPLTHLDWAQLSTSDYWLPPSAISLHGVEEFERLPEQSKRRLSQYEFVGFIQAGLWLESIFLERLGKSLKQPRGLAEYAYHLHEIREEAGHSLMFLRLMETSGLHLPGTWQKRPRFADFIGRHAPLNTTLFWLAVVLGEEIPDKLNRHVRVRGDAALNPLIRQMCTLHVIDEARHIAHARSALETGLRHSSALRKRLLTPVINLLLKQFIGTFYLPRPEIYELAGLTPGRKWRQLARANPVRQEFISTCINPTLHLLREHGFKLATPFR